MTAPRPETSPLTLDFPWRTTVGVKRLARKAGMTLTEYVTGLIAVELAAESADLQAQLAEEEAEARLERGES